MPNWEKKYTGPPDRWAKHLIESTFTRSVGGTPTAQTRMLEKQKINDARRTNIELLMHYLDKGYCLTFTDIQRAEKSINNLMDAIKS